MPGGLVGTLHRHRSGFGFVEPIQHTGEDVYVPAHEAAKAMDGDLVRVELTHPVPGKAVGRIVGVLKRRRRLLLGTYHDGGPDSFVVPRDPLLGTRLPVRPSRLARDGEFIKASLLAGREPPECQVLERLDAPDNPAWEALSVAYAKGFCDVFPPKVQAEAASVPEFVSEEQRHGRRELTGLPLLTIDGDDTKDLDDAVFVERLGGDYRLVVAVADVSHYVRAGTALDVEALRRGTSVYLPSQVLPMLPERLSNGICSLNPGVERLCMVADLRIDSDGQVVAADLYEAVMRSAAQCTYSEVERVLGGERVAARERFRDSFLLMAELQEKLTAMRERRGALDFELPQVKVTVADGGSVVDIARQPRCRAHRIVEEFMLAANEAVARHFEEHGLAAIFRVHDPPHEERLETFLRLARRHGAAIPGGELSSRALKDLLAQLAEHPQHRALNQLLLYSMTQAAYSPENLGHYGLAAGGYLHFTSPIRRYPDLMVHRLLKASWAGTAFVRGHREASPAPETLSAVASICNERERAAAQTEREVHAYFRALFMQDKVGQRFAGTVSSIAPFGVFVELERWPVEGLIRREALGEDFELDGDSCALVQPGTGRAFRVGDPIHVEVLGVSLARRQMDLVLARRAENDGSQDGMR